MAISSSIKCLDDVGHDLSCLTEPSGNIVFSELVQRVQENLVGGADFNEISQMKICSPMGNPGCLLPM